MLGINLCEDVIELSIRIIYITMQMHISCPCVRMKASVLKDCPYLAYFTLMVTRHIISFNNYIHSLILCSKRRKLLRNDNVTFRSIYFTRYYINLHHFETFFERDLFIQSFKQLVVGAKLFLLQN